MTPRTKRLLSAFIVLHVLVVLFINAPIGLAGRPTNASREAARADWLIRRYAHLVGVDNRWTMFSSLHRFDWRYLVKARYDDGAAVLLPLPRQSERGFWDRNFTDFKEAKFDLNLYSDPAARAAYASFLCREFPRRIDSARNLDHRTVSVDFELQWRTLFDPQAARARGAAKDPDAHSLVLNRFPCPS